MTAALERRLARLETLQPKVPEIVAVARRWVANWDDLRPRLHATLADLVAKQALGHTLDACDLRMLALADEASISQRVDLVFEAAVEIASPC